MWTYFVAGAVDPVWPQEIPASRIARAPSQVKPPTLPTLPQAAPQSPAPESAGAQNASDRHCSCDNIDVVSEFTSRSSQEIVAEWAMRFAVDRIRPGHMKSLGLRFRDEGQATRRSTRVRCGNGWNVVAIWVARVVGCATTYIRIWVIARCCNANLRLRHQ